MSAGRACRSLVVVLFVTVVPRAFAALSGGRRSLLQAGATLAPSPGQQGGSSPASSLFVLTAQNAQFEMTSAAPMAGVLTLQGVAPIVVSFDGKRGSNGLPTHILTQMFLFNPAFAGSAAWLDAPNAAIVAASEDNCPSSSIGQSSQDQQGPPNSNADNGIGPGGNGIAGPYRNNMNPGNMSPGNMNPGAGYPSYNAPNFGSSNYSTGLPVTTYPQAVPNPSDSTMPDMGGPIMGAGAGPAAANPGNTAYPANANAGNLAAPYHPYAGAAAAAATQYTTGVGTGQPMDQFMAAGQDYQYSGSMGGNIPAMPNGGLPNGGMSSAGNGYSSLPQPSNSNLPQPSSSMPQPGGLQYRYPASGGGPQYTTSGPQYGSSTLQNGSTTGSQSGNNPQYSGPHYGNSSHQMGGPRNSGSGHLSQSHYQSHYSYQGPPRQAQSALVGIISLQTRSYTPASGTVSFNVTVLDHIMLGPGSQDGGAITAVSLDGSSEATMPGLSAAAAPSPAGPSAVLSGGGGPHGVCVRFEHVALFINGIGAHWKAAERARGIAGSGP